MPNAEVAIATIWFIRGEPDAAGWDALRQDSKDEKVDIIHLDPRVWALLRADAAPQGYEGLESSPPPDGLYLDPQGRPLYLVGGEVVRSPEEVIATLGERARELLEEIGDPVAVLDRMGKVF